MTSFTKMRSMFQNSNFSNLNLSSWNTSSVTEMFFIFQESIISNLDLSSWNTSSVTDMFCMFEKSNNSKLDYLLGLLVKTMMDYMFNRSLFIRFVLSFVPLCNPPSCYSLLLSSFCSPFYCSSFYCSVFCFNLFLVSRFSFISKAKGIQFIILEWFNTDLLIQIQYNRNKIFHNFFLSWIFQNSKIWEKYFYHKNFNFGRFTIFERRDAF